MILYLSENYQRQDCTLNLEKNSDYFVNAVSFFRVFVLKIIFVELSCGATVSRRVFIIISWGV